jgi:hypothetical protein
MGRIRVTTMAIPIPAAAHKFPLRAVLGLLSLLRPTINMMTPVI